MYYHLFLFTTMFYMFTYFSYIMLEKLITLNSLTPKKASMNFTTSPTNQKNFSYILK